MLKREEDMLKDIPQQIADNAFDAVNELLSIDTGAARVREIF